jgi:GAF domain-containing protein
LETTIRRLEQQTARLDALRQAGIELAMETSLPVVLQRITELSKAMTGARYSALGVADQEGDLVQFVTSGIAEGGHARIGHPPVGRGTLGLVVREGQTIRLDDVRQHESFTGFPPHHPEMAALLAVPIRSEGRTSPRWSAISS